MVFSSKTNDIDDDNFWNIVRAYQGIETLVTPGNFFTKPAKQISHSHTMLNTLLIARMHGADVARAVRIVEAVRKVDDSQTEYVTSNMWESAIVPSVATIISQANAEQRAFFLTELRKKPDSMANAHAQNLLGDSEALKKVRNLVYNCGYQHELSSIIVEYTNPHTATFDKETQSYSD